MEPTTINGKSALLPRPQKGKGFTLIELLVVMAIIATLMTLVVPQYFRQHTKAQETVLRHNLVSIRQALEHYRDDKGVNPGSLEDLVTTRYLREVPLDPITGKRDTWKFEPGEEEGMGEVTSGAPGKSADGTEYGTW